MIDEDSTIIDFYHEGMGWFSVYTVVSQFHLLILFTILVGLVDFDVDVDGKRFLWQVASHYPQISRLVCTLIYGLNCCKKCFCRAFQSFPSLTWSVYFQKPNNSGQN